MPNPRISVAQLYVPRQQSIRNAVRSAMFWVQQLPNTATWDALAPLSLVLTLDHDDSIEIPVYRSDSEIQLMTRVATGMRDHIALLFEEFAKVVAVVYDNDPDTDMVWDNDGAVPKV